MTQTTTTTLAVLDDGTEVQTTVVVRRPSTAPASTGPRKCVETGGYPLSSWLPVVHQGGRAA